MSNLRLTIGGDFEEEAAQRFVDAWHRAEKGEPVSERHLAFESWGALRVRADCERSKRKSSSKAP